MVEMVDMDDVAMELVTVKVVVTSVGMKGIAIDLRFVEEG